VKGCRNLSWPNTPFTVHKGHPYIITTFRHLLSLRQARSLHNEGLRCYDKNEKDLFIWAKTSKIVRPLVKGIDGGKSYSLWASDIDGRR